MSIGDLKEDKHLLMYFQPFLDRRDNLEKEGRRQQSSTAAVGARSLPGNGDGTTQPSQPRDDTLYG